jgi:hypothetical protein
VNTAVATLTNVGLKVLGAIVLYLVGRALIAARRISAWPTNPFPRRHDRWPKPLRPNGTAQAKSDFGTEVTIWEPREVTSEPK